MNNFEKLKSLDIDVFAKWLECNGRWDDSPWDRWFNQKYCQQCEPVMQTIDSFLGESRECEFAWCEINKTCRFCPDDEKGPTAKDVVRLWLEAEAEE